MNRKAAAQFSKGAFRYVDNLLLKLSMGSSLLWGESHNNGGWSGERHQSYTAHFPAQSIAIFQWAIFCFISVPPAAAIDWVPCVRLVQVFYKGNGPEKLQNSSFLEDAHTFLSVPPSTMPYAERIHRSSASIQKKKQPQTALKSTTRCRNWASATHGSNCITFRGRCARECFGAFSGAFKAPKMQLPHWKQLRH